MPMQRSFLKPQSVRVAHFREDFWADGGALDKRKGAKYFKLQSIKVN
jgi:hypothetical protein